MTRLEERVAKIRNLLQPMQEIVDELPKHVWPTAPEFQIHLDAAAALLGIKFELDAMLTDDCCPKHGIEKSRCGCDHTEDMGGVIRPHEIRPDGGEDMGR